MKKLFNLLLGTFIFFTLTATDPPNVVFILADDLGVNDLSLYGSTFHETPNIDALANKGMIFTQAYSANPLCSPTRASIMTGLYPSRIGITVPVCHLNKLVLEKHLAESAPPRNKTLAAGFFYPFPIYDSHGKPGSNLEDLMCDEAVKYIHEHKNEPFFLNYWTWEVHAPWQAKEHQIDKYRAKADALQQSTDFFPTFVDMLGWEDPAGLTFDGVSMKPSLENNKTVRDEIFCHYPHGSPSTSLRQGDWKLIRWWCDNADQSDRYELYNLAADEGEALDLASAEPQRWK